jgi:isopenicillin N synthase-like dioxygenase
VPDIPIIDLGGASGTPAARRGVATAIDAACRHDGFFYVVGHGVDPALGDNLERLAREFFALDGAEKSLISMDRAGRSWRGWFPVGGELTSGVPDAKEGIYFGSDLPAGDARVVAGIPLHGPNLYPSRPDGFGAAVAAYLDAMTALGHRIMSAMALGLGLDADWFATNMTDDPTLLFRIFHYPPAPASTGWGVAEHTDYGLLTILRQDAAGGLEVRTGTTWTPAPPIPGSFVCNLGDMLERMTGGRYRSTPHRVRNTTESGRLSFAFFFDPSWGADVRPIPGAADPLSGGAVGDRWDGASVHDFDGTYGDYLLGKVAKVFPDLGSRVLDE